MIVYTVTWEKNQTRTLLKVWPRDQTFNWFWSLYAGRHEGLIDPRLVPHGINPAVSPYLHPGGITPVAIVAGGRPMLYTEAVTIGGAWVTPRQLAFLQPWIVRGSWKG